VRLHRYSVGSILEERFQLAGTYNCLNAVKYELLTGKQRLSDAIPRIRQLRISSTRTSAPAKTWSTAAGR
jgi:hypothetical protein